MLVCFSHTIVCESVTKAKKVGRWVWGHTIDNSQIIPFLFYNITMGERQTLGGGGEQQKHRDNTEWLCVFVSLMEILENFYCKG